MGVLTDPPEEVMVFHRGSQVTPFLMIVGVSRWVLNDLLDVYKDS